MVACGSVRAVAMGLSPDLTRHTDFVPSIRCAPCVVSRDGRNSVLGLTTKLQEVRSPEDHIDFHNQTLRDNLARSLRHHLRSPTNVPWRHRLQWPPHGLPSRLQNGLIDLCRARRPLESQGLLRSSRVLPSDPEV